MVAQSNLYATQYVLKTNVGPIARAQEWVPTGKKGIVQLGRIRDNWSTSKLFSFPLAKSTMNRNRFELLLRFWHFTHNEDAHVDNRLYKLQDLMDKFIANFKRYYTPGEKICIDESVVPFGGRLVFRQYIPGKRHRYGVKLNSAVVTGTHGR